MADALIGATGFVGGNILRQRPFDALYRSTNIEEMAGRSFGLLVCAGAPAEKWRANKDPDADRESLRRLMRVLDATRAERVVLISTVDVYPVPREVDEDTPIDPRLAQPYGRHRLELEHFITERFDALVVRLPGLFGDGLKKNIVFDLLHGNRLDQVQGDAVFQFYGLDTIWRDIEVAMAAGLPLINVGTEPVSVREVARHAFGMEFDGGVAGPAPRYDMRSRHAELYGGAGGYLQSRERVLEDLAAFVRRTRAAS